MKRKYEGFYKSGFQTAKHKLKVIQQMKKMTNKKQAKHEKSLPEQPKIAKPVYEKINVGNVVRRDDSFEKLAE